MFQMCCSINHAPLYMSEKEEALDIIKNKTKQKTPFSVKFIWRHRETEREREGGGEREVYYARIKGLGSNAFGQPVGQRQGQREREVRV